MESWTEIATARGIRYFFIAFVDLFGVLRSKLVPAAAMDQVAKSGAGFAGFAVWYDMTPADADMVVMPEQQSIVQLPWKPEVAWVTGDVIMGGKQVDQNPRHILKKLVARAANDGFDLKTGVECEFFLVSPDGTTISDGDDRQSKPCYDQQALMRRYDIVSEICDAMLSLGWHPYQNDHEDGNGQFEMNWEYDSALVTADRHVFFKFMVKSIAEKHGMRATFMPKPFNNLTGSGCHVHASLWSNGNENVFADASDELGLSRTAYQFIGGLIHSAEAICALTNPAVNSYKRINAPRTISGATWSPNTVSYGGNNRTHMIRIPDAGRFEFRLADGAANPYLLQAAILASENSRDPGKRLDINMYADGHTVKGVKKLPLNLLDALRNLENSVVARAAFGDAVIDSYVKLKNAEWDDYCRHLTGWEFEKTLDC